VAGKQPELWNPVTGEISPCPQFQTGEGVVRLALKLPPNGATFVVFRNRAEGDHSKPLPAMEKPDAQAAAATTLAGPWRIEFQPGRAGDAKFEITSPTLFLWNENADARIQAFAGTAAYQTTFDVATKSENPKRMLDLGVVHNLAEVLVNGHPACVVWTAPFSVDVTKFVKPGKNTLEIRVVNTWHNWRLANKFVPMDHSWASRGLTEPPLPAGLLGPVTLSTGQSPNIK